MIKSIYIDNFKCLTNFRIEPRKFQLWLGDNGSGKTSVLDALRCVQQLLRAGHVEDVFNKSTLTAWDKRLEQTIGISMVIDDEEYDYRLVVEFSKRDSRARIKREELKWKGHTFFLFDTTEESEAHLYRINRISQEVEEGTRFPADWSRSTIPTIPKRNDNWPLIRFREEIDACLLIQPVPMGMEEVADSEIRYLTPRTENFAQWYRHVHPEYPGVTYRAKDFLAEVLPGFQILSLKETGEARKLTAAFRSGAKDYDVSFRDLSEGQRQLIVLYTILESFREGILSSLFIDEPDNFISLREIQPWLDSLRDISEEKGKQAIIISHHPEIINTMARGDELWFSRKDSGHTEIRPYPTPPGLSPAESVARGWENE